MTGSLISHAYFIGDVHMDRRYPEREISFCRLLDEVARTKPDHLFLMGDLFEFWFGYEKVMFCEHLKAIMKIGQITEKGIPVTYITGNHDFYPGRVFEGILGISVEKDPIRVLIGSHSVYLAHGDEINKADIRYRIVRAFLRSPISQTMFRLFLPPTIAWYIGHATSDSSRKYRSQKERPVTEDIFNDFCKIESATGIDTVIHGHNHDPGIRQWEGSGRELTIIDSGDWLGTQGHYVEFINDQFRCKTWPF
ncbi:UDP-2,3-diacylglucosamine diphosphatase [bacterium]|nr:UDP-2,3-diacylglucosamine diphosphatase [bacterium]